MTRRRTVNLYSDAEGNVATHSDMIMRRLSGDVEDVVRWDIWGVPEGVSDATVADLFRVTAMCRLRTRLAGFDELGENRLLVEPIE